jgi:hypothetical protein
MIVATELPKNLDYQAKSELGVSQRGKLKQEALAWTNLGLEFSSNNDPILRRCVEERRNRLFQAQR